LPELLWAILAKKPVRMLTSCISPDRIWQAETLMKALVIAIMVAGPFLVRLKRIRWGLLLFLLLIPMALWLYKFEARQFFAVSVVNMAFIFALAKSVPKKTLIAFLFLTMSISSVFYTLEVQKGRSAVYNSEVKSARVAAGLLPERAKVAASWPTTMVLYRPDISVVTMPASMEDLTLIERRVKLDAVVLSLHEQGIVLWGWREDTLVVGSDTLFTYLKPR
jgi:signal transduction histidine kinase